MEEIIEALNLYDLNNPTYTLIRHNENKTYHVVDGQNEYLLRIHEPINGFNDGLLIKKGNKFEKIESELKALEILNNNGFSVQKPIYTKKNELFSTLSNQIPVSMLTWITGENLGANYKNKLNELGIMIARLHKVSPLIDNYSIYYDEILVDELIKGFINDYKESFISLENKNILVSTLEEVKVVMEKLSKTENKGYIHSDLSFSNIILSSDMVIPIDFSLAGFGYFAHEIGMILCNIIPIEERKALVESYEKELKTKLNVHDVDAFFCLSIVLYICLQKKRLYKEESFTRRMNYWTNNYFNNFVNNISFSY